MTAFEVGAAVRRQWYVLLVVLLCVAGAIALMLEAGGLYSTSTVIQFAQPERSRGSIGANSDLENDNFIAFAGAVASEVNNGKPVMRYARESAPLYGAGIREGILVALPDAGGQWMTSYTRAEIEIQIVGPTRDWVSSQQEVLIDKVFNSSRTLQGAAYHSRSSIQASVVPLTTNIEHVTASRGEQLIGIVAMLAAGLLVGSWAAVRVDGVIGNRKSHKATDTSSRLSGPVQ